MEAITNRAMPATTSTSTTCIIDAILANRDHQKKWSWTKHYHHFVCELGTEEVIVSLLRTEANIGVGNSTLGTLWSAKKMDHKPELVSLLLAYRAAVGGCRGTERVVVTRLLQHSLSLDTRDELSKLTLTLNSRDIARMLLVSCVTLRPRTLSVMPALLLRSTKADPDFYQELKEQLGVPFPLQRLCAESIRMHHNRSILEHLTKLQLPKTTVKYLDLDRYEDSPYRHQLPVQPFFQRICGTQT